MIDICPRRDRWIRGCRFEPRYDEGEPSSLSEIDGTREFVRMLIETSKPKTYVRDVCVTCGRTIERRA